MEWVKKGLVYGPDGKYPWARHSALQPTPFLISDEVIRVYVGFRDKNGVSRVGFVDLNANNPSAVLKVSDRPVLDVGEPGTFDENGVVPCAIVRREQRLYLYYAGYQLGQKVRFFVFGGLAISDDGGITFTRHSQVPVLDRTDDELFFRVLHSIIFEGGVWEVWYGGGNKFLNGENTSMPVYDVRYLESADGINFRKTGQVCIPLKNADEYRVGRPYVIKKGEDYLMFYGAGTQSKGYRLGYAVSRDRINWTRKDKEIGIDVSDAGWDSEMICYPSIVEYKDSVYMFYNGNNYGYDGFGLAILKEW